MEPQSPPVIADYFFNRETETIIVLFINTVLAVFIFHVIWTQSDSLGSFKYYLLYQFIVAQILEFGLLLANPVFMGAYIAAYVSGVFGYISTTELICYIAFLGLILCCHSLTGIFLSLFNRYVFIFRPHWKEHLHNKYTLTAIVLFLVFFDGMFIYGARATIMSHEAMVQRAKNESCDNLNEWFSKENRFIYIPELDGMTRTFCFILICTLVVFFFILIGIIIWFVVNVFILKKTCKTLNENSSYLLIAVLVQTGTNMIFFMVPNIVILVCCTFAIDNSANVVNAVLQLFILNGTADALVMVCLVKPYRVYCIKLIHFISWRRKKSAITPPVSFYQTSAIQ